jgi:hypothetical protein
MLSVPRVVRVPGAWRWTEGLVRVPLLRTVLEPPFWYALPLRYGLVALYLVPGST